MGLTIKPITLKAANAYVIENHRHHDKTQGQKFSIACYDGDKLVGVAIVGRPVSRMLDNGETLEVTRLCTDGTRNACSILYGRCARIAKEMGYKKIITYILDTEVGSSLKASGWEIDMDKVGGGTWSRHSRPRGIVTVDIFGETIKYPIESKVRWAKRL